jgi:hypothetical protein
VQAKKTKSELKKYIKNGKECVLCHSRKKLIQITPEEIIRQEFVLKLISELNVPIEMIDVEVPLSYYQKGKRGRADIIVSGFDKENFEKIPLIVIECKAPTIHLTDKVFEQTMQYDEFLEPEIMVMTNGQETICYSWDNEIREYREIISIPNYSDLIKGKGIEFQEEIVNDWKRPNHKDNVENNREILLADYNLGEDTDIKLVPFITNLVGLIYDDNEKAKQLHLKSKSFISDGGIRFTTFGNAAGGSFTGEYRYFIVENDNRETELVSLSIMGKISTKNHPKWGNSNGFTLFNVAIDDFENSHMSLEYSIDRFVEINDNKYSFWHDGTLTVGNKGRAKNKDVIDFIKKHNPNLIKNDKIFLGTIDNSKPFVWNDKNVNELIANFIDYGFVRDEFRKTHK